MTQHLDKEIKFCPDFFGGVLFGLRCPWRVGRPAGAAVVRSCAGDRRVEIYNVCHTPGTYMPPTGFDAMAHNTYVQYYLWF